MFDPLRRLKYLPWIALLQVGLITILIAIAIDGLLILAIRIPVIFTLLARFLNSPLALLLELATAAGLGTLAVTILERWFRQVILNTATLWALVPCVALWLGLRPWLPLPVILTPELGVTSLTCITLGIFWKGKSYWRW
jgi:hypothetical protein